MPRGELREVHRLSSLPAQPDPNAGKIFISEFCLSKDLQFPFQEQQSTVK